MFYKLIGGKHADEKGVQYKKGDIIESEVDLFSLFRGKFEKVEGPDIPKPYVKPAIPKPSRNENDPPVSAGPEVKLSIQPKVSLAQYGDDVTSQFDAADPESVRIYFKKGSGYIVIDVNDNEPYHDEPMKKKQVTPFLLEEVYEA